MGRARTTLAAVCAALLPLAACGVAQGQEPRVRKGRVLAVPAADPKPYARADAAFGLGLLAAWCRTDPHANLVLSPSSLAAGLGMAALGARVATATAMARALRLPPGDPVPGLAARTRALRGLNRSGVALRVTDQVWADRRLPPSPGYLDRVATAYDAALKTLDVQGDPDGARAAINDAVAKATSGRIKDLLGPGTVARDTGWVLTDAVYLKADWADRFKASETSGEPFTTAAGGTAQVRMMSAHRDLAAARTAGWTAVDLPYRGGRLSMTALLPDDRSGGCPALDAARLDRVTAALAPRRVDLGLPKTDLKDRIDAVPLLRAAGMGEAFGPRADFTGLSPRAEGITFVRHAATMRVDEKGTEAAAATGAGIGATAAAPVPALRVTFDRPYVLLVRDQATGEPLFLARVADPSRS
ncbi:serpin family protein [Actinomadura rayongensis]|uniref:Serpin family protein n=1 Tax=Actinomadura rayongensis TaxID=1429076 RepID=A0A6I4WK61_9ACTN|nr:serpin family protein [Actinomadura rayongensis]MXQ67344.1 serpin family protein [Actinomadura rayongensis]